MGDHGAPLAGLSELYYNPTSYKILPFKHNYTDTEDYVLTGYFIPMYMAINREDCLDHRGVPNIKKAKAFYLIERDALAGNPPALIAKKAERCWTAEEAFAAEGDNKFNKVKISELVVRLRIMLKKPNILTGYMQFTYNGPKRDRNSITGVRFIPNPSGPVHVLQPPLWEIDNDKEPEESEEDYQDRIRHDERIVDKVSNLYVGGIDGIDIGQSETSLETRSPSKFCTVIKRRVYGMKEPEYVAYYLDRPLEIRDAYIQTIGMLMWYNCLANLEATRVSILTYARDNKFMQYFMQRPRSCFGDILKRRQANQYGTTATKVMIEHQTDLLRDYIEDYCHNIWFLEFLDLFLKYTDENKGKFDIVAACCMAEIADEELSGIAPKSQPVLKLEYLDIGYYIDENGYKRYGVIPKTRQFQTKVSWNLYDGRNITTNPYRR